MDWAIKGRLLVIGCILIVLGLVFFVARGSDAALVLPVIGIVLLMQGFFMSHARRR